MNWKQWLVTGVWAIVATLTVLFPADIYGQVDFLAHYAPHWRFDFSRLFLLHSLELILALGFLWITAPGLSQPTWQQKILLLGFFIFFARNALFPVHLYEVNRTFIFEPGYPVNLSVSLGFLCYGLLTAFFALPAAQRDISNSGRLLYFSLAAATASIPYLMVMLSPRGD